MIQRIQTLWMVLAAIFIFLTIQLPFYSGTLAVDNTYHVLKASENFLILILTSALGTGIVINIFLFRHRSVQMKIILVGILLEALIIFLYMKNTKEFSAGEFNLWAILHFLIFISLFFAAKGIYRDSRLIKESNRLR